MCKKTGCSFSGLVERNKAGDDASGQAVIGSKAAAESAGIPALFDNTL